MLARILVLTTCTIFLSSIVQAQYTADKVAGPKHKETADSIKQIEYNHVFPIWGEKVAKKGFKLPKSAGVSVQYITQTSDIIIDNLQVGFNHNEMHSLQEVVKFNSAKATSSGINVRPDLWLFPFLNIYGILAKTHTSTAIDAGVWLPDSSGWHQVASISTKPEFEGTTVGFGITPMVGVNGYFFMLDANFSWTDIDALEKPAFIFVLGPRAGKTFKFKKPEMNLTAWIGGFRVQMSSNTTGSLNFADLFPTGDWQTKINAGYEKVATNQASIDAWWSGLTPVEQKNPVNVAKYETANRVNGAYGKVVDGASQVAAGVADGSVQYSLTKTPKDKWNFLIGSQFQINRSWMVRAEYGFLSSRQQFIGGVQYRFDL